MGAAVSSGVSSGGSVRLPSLSVRGRSPLPPNSQGAPSPFRSKRQTRHLGPTDADIAVRDWTMRAAKCFLGTHAT